MSNKIEMPDWKAVGRHYDLKGEDDLNYLVALDKRIVHHHSGIFDDSTGLFDQDYSESELLRILGESENRLSILGAEALGLREKRGLDCGCGRGGSSFLLARDYGHNMFGITVSDSQLAFTTATSKELNLQKRTSFAKLNIFYDKIPGHFDFVWACESTEYMPDHDLLFKKWNSLLKSHGKVALFVITYRQTQLEAIEPELREVDRIYETKIGEFSDYLRAALVNGFILDDLIGLEDQIIPYYRLRLRSENRRGSEEPLLKGLVNGFFKYSLMLFSKK